MVLLRKSKILFLIVFCCTTVLLNRPAAAETESVDSPQEESTPPTAKPVFCLSTDRYLLDAAGEKFVQSRMLREIARQAVLLAAREELGLPTRDETLGEPFPTPEGQQLGPLALTFHAYSDGRYELHLVLGDAKDGNAKPRELWAHQGRLLAQQHEMYEALVQQITIELPAIADALREAGFVGTPKPFRTDEEPLPKAGHLLREMNFVSQYAAVRAAHQALAGEGPSMASLSVLVRGYAHLTALTPHLWSTHYEAFAARSLLYAERMQRLSDNAPLANWHRAYSTAIIGMHSTGLAILDSLDQPSEDEDRSAGQNADDSEPSEFPTWTHVVRPYCEFDHEQLKRIASAHSDLKELVAFLRWEQFRSYQHGRWIYEKGLETAGICPEAYSVYSVMAKWSALRIKRVGASLAMQAFESRLPKRVASLDGLPIVVKHVGLGEGYWSRIFGGESEEDASSRGPMQFSKALMKYTKQTEEPTDPSWAVLGSLIAEEQFVQIANMIHVAQGGTEHSDVALVDRVLPLIEGHRYANYIRTFALPRGTKANQVATVADGLRIVDPRPNMQNMFWRLAKYRSSPEAASGTEFAWRLLFMPTLTQAGVIESAYGTHSYILERIGPEHNQKRLAYCRDVSPHSPNSFVLGMSYAKDIDMAKLASWEAEAGDDPVAWLNLGFNYYKRWEVDAAARCYKHSLEISPSLAATEGLADSYRHGGKEELWVPTLESYLEYEDLGLAHAQIHQKIANHHIDKLNWAEALPHAEAAAKTWSAWGLLLAGRVHEGLRNWEKSEYWVAEASRHYPSYSSGIEWYLWCRRTGRGDLGSASEIAERWVTLQANIAGNRYNVGAYYLLEDQPDKALKIFQDLERKSSVAEKAFDKAWYLAQVALLAETVGEEQLRSDSIKRLRQIANGPVKKTKQELTPIIIALCDLMQGKDVAAEKLDNIIIALNKLETYRRCNYCYFLGAALEELGQVDKADVLFRQAAFDGPFNYVNSTLAGHRLVSRHGPQRGGPPVEDNPVEDSVESDIESVTEQPERDS